MNIGEISKPSVDRAQIKKSTNVRATDPVAPSKKVSDLVELSEESRNKSKEHQTKTSQPDNPSELSVDESIEQPSKPVPSIDFNV